MMKAFKFLLIASAVVVMTGCKLFVTVGEGGTITGSGGNNCSGNSVCEVDVSDTTFTESFTAIPATGFEFLRWEEGDGFLCGNSTNPTCTVDTTPFAGNTNIEAALANNALTTAIRPIFKPVDGYLGLTSDSYDGSGGLVGWTAACQAEYTMNTVVCSTKQILDGPAVANIVFPSKVWVRGEVVGSGGSLGWTDYSGYYASDYRNRTPYCHTTSTTTAFFAITLKPNLETEMQNCSTALPIACCR